LIKRTIREETKKCQIKGKFSRLSVNIWQSRRAEAKRRRVETKIRRVETKSRRVETKSSRIETRSRRVEKKEEVGGKE
jgi:hypothetical protein